jgi:hypothetical protein
MGVSSADADGPHCDGTVDELRSMVRRRAAGASFALKIFRMLTFTAANPEFRNGVGVFWCADGRHFWADRDIVAEFCALKPSAVNANLHDFGFRIRPQYPARELFHDAKWRCRYHSLITKATPEHAVARIGIGSTVDVAPEMVVQSLKRDI